MGWKIAVLSESPADEVGVRLLVEGLLDAPVECLRPHLRARGWPSVAQVLPAVIRHLHFRTDADALVVVVDSDDSVVHTQAHEEPGYHHPQCRLCQLRHVFRKTTRNLPPARGRNRLLRGIGLVVPAIEAWLLCGRDGVISESAWAAGLERGVLPYTRRELKERVYGTSRPPLPWEIRRISEEASRHRRDPRRLENDFPGGFGALARDVRSWGATSTPGGAFPPGA